MWLPFFLFKILKHEECLSLRPLLKNKIFVVLSIVSILTGCDSKEIIDKKTLAILGTEAPPFEITSFKGEQISLSKYKGNPIVINFWASWCAPCKREAGDLEKTYRFFKNREVVFIGIASDDTKDKALKFIEEFEITYPNGMDEEEAISKKYSVLTLPITFIIDREGKITFKKVGQIEVDKLKKEIRKVL